MTKLSTASTRFTMISLTLVLALLSLGASATLAGWFFDGRLTSDPAASYLSSGNARCMAPDDSGNLHVVWHDYRNGVQQVYYMAYNGMTWGTGTQIVDSPDGSRDPSVAVDEDGHLHVVWYDYRDGDSEIYYKTFDGSAWGVDERLTTAAGLSMNPAVAVRGDRVYVVWYDYRDGSCEIYFKEYDGAAWGADQRLTLTGKISMYPAVAAAGSDDIHVVWQDYRDGNLEIYHKWYDGVGWSSDTRVTDAAGVSQQPSIAADDSGHIHCVWEDSRDGNSEVYYGKFNGSSWEANHRLTNDTGSSISPAIARGSNAHLYVVWSDNRDGNYEIFYKEYDGSQWLDDERLTEASGTSKTPFVEVDAAGEVNVAWEDSRDGNREIYWKRSYTDTLPAPAVTGVDPDSGYVGETVQGLDITGSGFLFPDSVAFLRAGEPRLVGQSVGVPSSTHITCDISLLGAAPGWWDCVVINPDGHMDTLPSALMVTPAPKPEIASITPDSGHYGRLVEITDLAGFDFVYPDSIWLQKAGEPRLIAQNVEFLSPNQLSCEFDLFDPSVGPMDVVVRNPDGQKDTLAGGFNVTPAPAPDLISVSPDSGTSGELVNPFELAGDNFLDLALVSLRRAGGDLIEATDVTVDSCQNITCRLDLTGADRGHWGVVVTNRDGKADTMPSGFYVIPLPDPELYSVTPDSGSSGMGLDLTAIQGNHFVGGASLKLIMEGEPDIVPYRTTVHSSTMMSCEIGLAGADPGDWSVVVTNPDSGADTLVSGLKVLSGIWGDDIRLTYDPGYSITSDNNARCVAVDSEGHVHVVWDDDRGVGREIYYKQHDGETWGEDVRLTDVAGESADPAVAVDTYDNVHVVWNSNRAGCYNIYYKKLEGEVWSEDQQLSSSSCGGQFASIACDDTGAVHVVWEDCRDGNAEIYYRRLDDEGWSAEQRLTTWTGNSEGPSVATDGYNHVHVVWYDRHSGYYDIYYLESTLPMAWEPAQNLTTAGTGKYPCIAANTAGEVHVVWYDNGIYYRMYDGTEWGEILEVYNKNGTGPSIAVADEGAVHFIWSDNWDIYYKAYNGFGWIGGGRLRAASGMSEKGSIVADDNGLLHVVWWDERDGNREIYYKLGDTGEFAGTADPGCGISKLAITRIVPNPLAGNARVVFTLPSDGDAELAIFDVRGRLVWKRVFEGMKPGTHSVHLHAGDGSESALSPGVYFVRLRAGRQTAFTKAVVLR